MAVAAYDNVVPLQTRTQQMKRAGDLRRAQRQDALREQAVRAAANDSSYDGSEPDARRGATAASQIASPTTNPSADMQVGFAARAAARSAVAGGNAADIGGTGAASIAAQRATGALLRNQQLQEMQRRNQLRRLQHRKAQLNREVPLKLHQPTDILYFFAIITAVVGDFFDIAIIGILPGLSFVFTFMTTIIIVVLMALTGSISKRNRARKMAQKYGLLLVSALIESIGFGVNLLPIETFTMIAIFGMVLKERRKRIAAQKRRIRKKQIRANKEERALSRAERAQTLREQRETTQQVRRLQNTARKQDRSMALAA